MPGQAERRAEAQVLVVGPAWIGDMVMAQSLYRDLRRRNPGLAIDVLAPGWSAPVVARMPEVRRLIELPVGHGELGLGVRRRIGRELRSERYDRAIVLPRSFKSALVPWFARVPRRTGFRGEARHGLINDMRPLDRDALPLMVQRYLALGEPPGAPARPRTEIPEPRLTVDDANRARLLERLDLRVDRPLIAFMPAAEYGPAKRWPARHFAALARGLADDGAQIWLFGSERDQSICREIVDLTPGLPITDLSGRTGLGDAIDLIGLADWAVANDSGLMHVAAATDRRLIAIYGSSSPGYTPPLTSRARVLSLDLSCSPCFERECPLGHYRCLEALSPEMVLARIRADLPPGAYRVEAAGR